MNTMTSAANLFCPVMNIGYQHDTESTSNKADPEKQDLDMARAKDQTSWLELFEWAITHLKGDSFKAAI